MAKKYLRISGKESPVGKALFTALVLVAKGKPEGKVTPEGNAVRVIAILFESAWFETSAEDSEVVSLERKMCLTTFLKGCTNVAVPGYFYRNCAKSKVNTNDWAPGITIVTRSC